MHQALTKVVIFGTVLAMLGGCYQGHTGPKQTGGMLIGAGLGALAGAQVGRGRGQLAAVAIGALAGAAVGNSIGQSLDRADQLYHARAAARAGYAPIGRQVYWSNPDTGHYGSVTPLREGLHQGTGARCRDFRQSVTVNGETREFVGAACQAADGSWNVM